MLSITGFDFAPVSYFTHCFTILNVLMTAEFRSC